MKNIILTLLLLSILSNCKAQEGNIEALGSKPRFEIISGTYLKDINNDISHYLGTWKGTYNGKFIFLKIIKLTKNKYTNGDGSYFYEDEIKGFYTIYDGDPNLPNTTIIANSMTVGNELAPLFSVGDGRNNKYKLAYKDYQFCSVNGQLILERILSNPNQLIYKFSFFREIIMDSTCPYDGAIPIPLPEATITLTRVN